LQGEKTQRREQRAEISVGSGERRAEELRRRRDSGETK
jgi:hypothetical protein